MGMEGGDTGSIGSGTFGRSTVMPIEEAIEIAVQVREHEIRCNGRERGKKIKIALDTLIEHAEKK